MLTIICHPEHKEYCFERIMLEQTCKKRAAKCFKMDLTFSKGLKGAGGLVNC